MDGDVRPGGGIVEPDRDVIEQGELVEIGEVVFDLVIWN